MIVQATAAAINWVTHDRWFALTSHCLGPISRAETPSALWWAPRGSSSSPISVLKKKIQAEKDALWLPSIDNGFRCFRAPLTDHLKNDATETITDFQVSYKSTLIDALEDGSCLALPQEKKKSASLHNGVISAFVFYSQVFGTFQATICLAGSGLLW